MAPQGVVVKSGPAQRVGMDPGTALSRYTPSASNPWDARKAAHLMRRAGFGPTPEEIEAVVALGPDRTVDLLLAVSTTGLTARGIVTLSNGERASVDYLYGARPQWLDAMVSTRYPLKEKMALFWHDHWSVGARDYYKQKLLVGHVNIFRKHGLGRFRDMVLAVTMDPAMLWFLDNHINGRPVAGQPQINENYGRELLELYTMGVDAGYTQRDVREVSKVLSGWSLAGEETFAFKGGWHVPGDKVVLGRTIRSNGQQEFHDLLDNVILPHPATAKFVVRKIWEYFVAPNPDLGIVDELARRFRKSGLHIGELMRDILRCNYFYSEHAMRRLVKNPAEVAVGLLRNTNTKHRSYRILDQSLLQMGYPLLDYGNPSGLPDGMAWIDEIGMLARANVANDISRGWYNFFDPFREVLRKKLGSAEAIVDHYLAVLVDGDVPDDVRKLLYHFMHVMDHGNTVKFTFTRAKVNEKVRGLVHLITSLPQYQVN